MLVRTHGMRMFQLQACLRARSAYSPVISSRFVSECWSVRSPRWSSRCFYSDANSAARAWLPRLSWKELPRKFESPETCSGAWLRSRLQQAITAELDLSSELHLMAESQAWVCSACTYENAAGDSCEVCGTAVGGEQVSMRSSDREWECSACTYVNSINSGNCEICLTERKQETSTPASTGAPAGTGNGDVHSNRHRAIRRGGMSQGAEEGASGSTAAAGSAQDPVSLSSPRTAPVVEDGPAPSLRRAAPQPGYGNSPSTELNPGSASFNQWLSPKVKRSSSVATEGDSGAPPAKRRSVATFVEEAVEEPASPLLAEKQDEGQEEDEAKPTGNALLASLHAARLERMAKAGKGEVDGETRKPGRPTPAPAVQVSRRGKVPAEQDEAKRDVLERIVLLTYNVWFREDLEVERRMAAIGEIIEQHVPHVICLQEVTPNIYKLLQQSGWWAKYQASLSFKEACARPYFTMQLSRLRVKSWHVQPFLNSQMGRELSVAALETGKRGGLMVASSHLESPCPAPPSWDQMFSKERVAQAREALKGLDSARNVIFCGDMNWDDALDGPMPLPPGWQDAWQVLRPGQPGLTYDCKANKMLEGGRLQKRLDRVFCKLQDFELEDIEMVGTEAIPGLTYQKERKVKRQPQLFTLPVLPSDHFGLLFRIKAR